MGCGTSFVKYVLFFFNLLFALCGLLILGIGVAVKLNVSDFQRLFDGALSTAPIWCIVLGSIIFVISFFGCCGAIRESHCMVVTYAIFLLIIIILQVIAGILIFVYIGDIGRATTIVMKELFSKYDSDTAVKELFDNLQSKFECCGVNGPSDYSLLVPLSCCASPTGILQSTTSTCLASSAYYEGCAPKLVGYLDVFGKTAGGVIIGVAVVEVIGAIFALCLANSIKNSERRYR